MRPTGIPALADLCDCPVLPRNYWTLPDGSEHDGGSIARDGGAAADEALDLGVTAWQIRCPACRRVHVTGRIG